MLLDWAGVLSGPAGVVLGAYGNKLFNRKVNKKAAEKLDVDAAQVIASAAVTLVAPLEKRVEELTDRVEAVEAENADTTWRLGLAISHIRALRVWIGIHIPDKDPPSPPADLGV